MKKDIYFQTIKYFLTLFTLILIPIYSYSYGIQNFLWLSDIGLFLTVVGLWLNSPLLISMAAVGVLTTELFWNIDYFADLLFAYNISSLSDYMFDASYPLFLRGLSLFHVITPIIWIWYLAQYGYDKCSFIYFTFLYWSVLFLIYFGTSPEENINWVFSNQINNIGIASPVWFLFLFIAFPLFIFLPTHYVLQKIFATK